MTDSNNPPKHGYKSGASRPQLSLSTNHLASSTRNPVQLSPLQELTMGSEPDSGAPTGNQPPIGPTPGARPRRPSNVSHSRQSSRASAASDTGREPREHRSRRESTASQASDVREARRRESESRHSRHRRAKSTTSQASETGEVRHRERETHPSRHSRTESATSRVSETREEQPSSRSRRESNASHASDTSRERHTSVAPSRDLPLRQGAQPTTALPQPRRQHRPQPLQTQTLRVPQPLPGQFLPNYDPATGENPFVNTPMDGFDHTPGPFTPIAEHRFPGRPDDRTPRASAFNRASGAYQDRSQRGDPELGGLTEHEFNLKYDSNYRAGRDTYDPRSRGRRNQGQNRNNVPAHPLPGGRGAPPMPFPPSRAPPTGYGMQPGPGFYPPPAFGHGYGHPSPALPPQGYGNPYVQPSPTCDPYLGAYPAGQPGPAYPPQGGFGSQQPSYGPLGGYPGGLHGGAPRPPTLGNRAITIRAPGEQPRTILSPVAPTFNPTEVPSRQQAGRDRGERREASYYSTTGRRGESRHFATGRREESRHSTRSGRDESRHSTKSRKEEDGKGRRK